MLHYPYHIGLVIRKTAFIDFANTFSKDVFTDTEFTKSDDESIFMVWCGFDVCKPIYDAVVDDLIYGDCYMCAIGYTDGSMTFSTVDERGDPGLNTFGCSAGIVYEDAGNTSAESQ